MEDHGIKAPEGVELRPIPGFIGYAAGSDGYVYSFWRKGAGHGHGKGWTRGGRFVSRAPTKLSGCTTRNNRVLVGARRIGEEYKRFLAYRLIALAFHGPCPDGMECSHLNGNSMDNRPENLAWETRQKNENRKRDHGSAYRGEGHHRSRLTEIQVEEIRKQGRRFSTGNRPTGFVRDLADRYGVGITTIYKILDGQTWKHVRE